LDDPRSPERKDKVTRLILCTGKIYYDLTLKSPEEKFALREEYVAGEHIAIARVEELNPFPENEMQELLASYTNLSEVVWVQEEPRNMGAWSFIATRLAGMLPNAVTLRYIGRPDAASPAEGSQSRHFPEQARIVAEAYAMPITLPEAAKNGKTVTGRNGSGERASGNGEMPVMVETNRT
jgi:2-oxoglutarate dehydrogenase E1 component